MCSSWFVRESDMLENSAHSIPTSGKGVHHMHDASYSLVATLNPIPVKEARRDCFDATTALCQWSQFLFRHSERSLVSNRHTVSPSFAGPRITSSVIFYFLPWGHHRHHHHKRIQREASFSFYFGTPRDGLVWFILVSLISTDRLQIRYSALMK